MAGGWPHGACHGYSKPHDAAAVCDSRTGNGMFEAYLCAGVGVNETAVTGEGLKVDEGRSEPR